LGDPSAAYTLAVNYHHGSGLAQSEVDALQWLIIAVTRESEVRTKHVDGSEKIWPKDLAEMEKALAPSMVEQARRQAREWLAQFGKSQ
jgi:TPR repeat protein